MPTSPSKRPRVDKEGYIPWVQAFRAHLPQLAALTRFPTDLSIAARNAYLTYPTASQHAPNIGRYYAAPASAVLTYRPPSMLKMFNALHDIVEYANAWCAADDAAARKAAATARAKAAATAQPPTISEEETRQSLAILNGMLSDLGITPSH